MLNGGRRREYKSKNLMQIVMLMAMIKVSSLLKFKIEYPK